jgi:hypothetical protein
MLLPPPLPPPPLMQAAMEVVFFEAALQLLDEYNDSFLTVPEFVTFYDGLQQ